MRFIRHAAFALAYGTITILTLWPNSHGAFNTHEAGAAASRMMIVQH
jgi:hypothetical protein